jgi:hypothetical protein
MLQRITYQLVFYDSGGPAQSTRGRLAQMGNQILSAQNQLGQYLQLHHTGPCEYSKFVRVYFYVTSSKIEGSRSIRRGLSRSIGAGSRARLPTAASATLECARHQHAPLSKHLADTVLFRSISNSYHDVFFKSSNKNTNHVN